MSRLKANPVGDVANSYGDNSVKDLADDLQELASPIDRGEKITVAIERAANLSGLQRWRVFNIWYGKAKHVSALECIAVSTALKEKRRNERRNEWHELWTRLLRLESTLAQSDPEFHRPSINAARDMRRAIKP